MRRLPPALGPALLLAALSAPATAATIWDESTNGDLSNNGLSPTKLTLTAGSNRLIGSTGVPFLGLDEVDGLPIFGEVDRDYFTFTIAPGQQLDSMVVTNRNSPPGNDTFLGIETGPAVTEATNAVIPSKLWGYILYGDKQFNRTTRIGSDLLSQIFDLKNGKTGLGPLGPGTYSFWTQDTLNGAQIDYEFDFRVSQAAPVPLPAAWMLMSGALAIIGACRRRAA